MNTDRWRDRGWEPPPPPWWPLILAALACVCLAAVAAICTYRLITNL